MESELPVTDFSNRPTGCCPVFDPAPWDDREFSFSDLRFIIVKTRSLFYIPVNMGTAMSRAQKAIEKADAEPETRYLMLSEDLSKWEAHHYMLVSKDVPGYDAITIEGTWYAKAFDGPFNKMGIWMKEIDRILEERRKTVSRHLAFYTTCPRCAKEYGHNHVILFARID